jgi:hypothetical protein
MSHSAHLVGASARGTSTNGPARLALALVLAAWCGVVVLTSAHGGFVTPSGQPPLPLLAAVLLPIAVFAVAYRASEWFRAYVRAGDPRLLTELQSWRVLGGVFVVLMSFGLLPPAFAMPAGWGDVAIGVTAPFVARLVAAGGPNRSARVFIGWQLLGILDLVVAVGTGASLRLSGAEGADQMVAMSQLPLSMIPTFAVPLFVILHLASMAQVRAGASERTTFGRG